MKKIFVDGHIVGKNDGTASVGFSKIVIENKEHNIEYIKPNLTNSEAELIAIIHACLFAKDGDEIYTDSQFVEGAINKNWKVKEARLQNLVVVAKSILKVKGVKLLWIRRKQNPAT